MSLISITGHDHIREDFISQHKLSDNYLFEKNLYSLSQAEKAILGALLNYYHVYRKVFPTREKLAELVNKSLKTIDRALAKLQALGFFQKIKRIGFNISNVYILNYRFRREKFKHLATHVLSAFWNGLRENDSLIIKYKCKYNKKEILGSIRSVSLNASNFIKSQINTFSIKQTKVWEAMQRQDRSYLDMILQGCKTLIELPRRFLTQKERNVRMELYPEKRASFSGNTIFSPKSEQPLDVNVSKLWADVEKTEKAHKVIAKDILEAQIRTSKLNQHKLDLQQERAKIIADRAAAGTAFSAVNFFQQLRQAASLGQARHKEIDAEIVRIDELIEKVKNGALDIKCLENVNQAY